MGPENDRIDSRPCLFVGAAYGGTDDQTRRFIDEGTWEANPEGDFPYKDKVKSVRPGDRIAIKAAYTQKHGLPFENRGLHVSVMAIKAIGRVRENPGDGRTLKVDWQEEFVPPRQWYFYTSRFTAWLVSPVDWMSRGLISFAFDGQPQDLDRFFNEPFWGDRYRPEDDGKKFEWTRFYEAFADKLLAFRDKRVELISIIREIAKGLDLVAIGDQFKGDKEPLEDICPFTVMAFFSRAITDDNRRAVAEKFASLLGIEEEVPGSFEGISLVNNQGTCFFEHARDRCKEDIDRLWELFAGAIAFADTADGDEQDIRIQFITAYDRATECKGVGWDITIGLYCVRPWSFVTLDSRSRDYISGKLQIKIGLNGPGGYCSARDYLAVLDALGTRFKEEPYPVHSFPELYLAAWNSDWPGNGPKPYTLGNILEDGAFFPGEFLGQMLERLQEKKNLILQGPPGTGKTWLARRLAFALIGKRDESKLKMVQFHANLSYEDFIRGWRPSGEGRLELVDGPFLEMVKVAAEQPGEKFVVVIEEINRGNPAQIFGEMLTLLEADKRTPDEALELCYRSREGERVFIPANLFVIGTMNIADRSIALVDLALRRRFAFIDLEPVFGEVWRNWVCNRCGADRSVLEEVERRILALNDEISVDSSLGCQFRVGHSYLTPHRNQRVEDTREWFRRVVVTEIGPLLDEYWFDSPEKAREERKKLLQGF